MPKRSESAEKRADAEAKASAELAKASKASAILDSDYFRDKCEQIREEIWRMFATSQLEDDMARTIARHRLEAVNDIIRILKHDIDTGKFASIALEEIALDKERERRSNP